jgi:hypothetical protein
VLVTTLNWRGGWLEKKFVLSKFINIAILAGMVSRVMSKIAIIHDFHPSFIGTPIIIATYLIKMVQT